MALLRILHNSKLGRYLGLRATVAHIAHLSPQFPTARQIFADFYANRYGSVITTVQPLLWYFHHDSVFSRISSCGSGTASALRLGSSPQLGFFFSSSLFLTLAPRDHVTYCQARRLSGHTSPCGECALFILGLRPWTGCLLGWSSAFFLLSRPWYHMTTSPTVRLED